MGDITRQAGKGLQRHLLTTNEKWRSEYDRIFKKKKSRLTIPGKSPKMGLEDKSV